MAALGLSNKAVYEDDVNNGPLAEPAGSVAMYTEVTLLMLALCMGPSTMALLRFLLSLLICTTALQFVSTVWV